jgi:hypothetical protein
MLTNAVLAERARRLWRRDSGAPRSSPGPGDAGWQERLETLDARVEHLESALEGLQDAAYRREVLEDDQIDRLRRRTEPAQIARDLSRDARRRGL